MVVDESRQLLYILDQCDLSWERQRIARVDLLWHTRACLPAMKRVAEIAAFPPGIGALIASFLSIAPEWVALPDRVQHAVRICVDPTGATGHVYLARNHSIWRLTLSNSWNEIYIDSDKLLIDVVMNGRGQLCVSREDDSLAILSPLIGSDSGRFQCQHIYRKASETPSWMSSSWSSSAFMALDPLHRLCTYEAFTKSASDAHCFPLHVFEDDPLRYSSPTRPTAHLPEQERKGVTCRFLPLHFFPRPDEPIHNLVMDCTGDIYVNLPGALYRIDSSDRVTDLSFPGMVPGHGDPCTLDKQGRYVYMCVRKQVFRLRLSQTRPNETPLYRSDSLLK